MSTSKRRSMHVNSLAAYEEGRREMFSARELKIIDLFKMRGHAATDRDVMALLGYTDPNAVRPRITELVKDGILVECGTTKDNLTGKMVRIVSLRRSNKPTQPELPLA